MSRNGDILNLSGLADAFQLGDTGTVLKKNVELVQLDLTHVLLLQQYFIQPVKS
jgi:hypothetical protein